MGYLTIYPDDGPDRPERATGDRDTIIALLADAGVLFERWDAGACLPAGAGLDTVRAVCADAIAGLMERRGFGSMDIIGVTPDHPDATAMRRRFLAEHTHDEDEARFFVEGGACFYLHIGNRVYGVRCERGDMLSVPALVPHWSDIGARPRFTSIRFFTRPDGWVAVYTGSAIAAGFPEYCPGR